MTDPYRVAALVDPEIVSAPCPLGHRRSRCSGCAPLVGAPRFYARTGGDVSATTRPRGLGVLGKAVSLAAVGLLLTASASIAAVSYAVLENGFVARGTQAQMAEGEQAQTAAPIQQAAALPAPRPPAMPRAAAAAQRELSMLAELGPVTHAPEELWRRAQRLGEAGFEVLLVQRSLSLPIEQAAHLALPRRIVPEIREGAPIGVRIVGGVAPRSVRSLGGLENGDVVTAVNGYRLASPQQALNAYARADREVVVELERGGHRVILHLDWQPRG